MILSKPKVLLLGSTGMLGTYVRIYLEKNPNIEIITGSQFSAASISLENLTQIIEKESPTVVLNCIGVIKQRNAVGIESMIEVNALFPHRLMTACNSVGAKLIHISTDCVFSGHRGRYAENDPHDALDAYGKTKSLGEPRTATVIRTSIIGSENKNKLSLLEWVKSKRGKSCDGYVDHYWNGVTCLQLAKVIEKIITSDLYWQGVRHIGCRGIVNKFSLISMISGVYELGISVNPIRAGVCDRSLLIESPSDFESPSIEVQLKELREFDIQNNIGL